MTATKKIAKLSMIVLLFLCSACIAGQKDVYFDENMDFSSIQTIAVLPLKNLTREERLLGLFISSLLEKYQEVLQGWRYRLQLIHHPRRLYN